MQVIERGLSLTVVQTLLMSVIIAPVLPGVHNSSAETASICIAAFWDTNQNGNREAGEELIGGVPITILAGEKTVFRDETTTDKVTCFNVEPGFYSVTVGEGSLQNIVWTTQNSLSLDIPSNQTAMMDFGISQISISDPSRQSTTETDMQAEPADWTQMLGLLVFVLSIFSTPITIIVLILNIKMIRMIRQLKSDSQKETPT